MSSSKSILSILLVTILFKNVLTFSNNDNQLQNKPQSHTKPSSEPSHLAYPFFNPFMLDQDDDFSNLGFHNRNFDNEDHEINNKPNNDDDYYEIYPKILSINDQTLWQMANFATKQMNTNRNNNQFKLLSLDYAEKLNPETFKLKLTMNRIKFFNNDDFDINSKVHCTVELIDDIDTGKWQMDGYGCTVPAPVRTKQQKQPKKQDNNDNSESKLKEYLKNLRNKKYQFDLPKLSNDAIEMNTINLNERPHKMTTMKLPSSLPSSLYYQPSQYQPIRYIPYTYQEFNGNNGNYRYYY